MLNPLVFTSIKLNSGNQWVFTWADTGAGSYRVVAYGTELAVVTAPTYTYTGGNWNKNYPPPLEVCGINDQVWTDLYPPYFLLQWFPVANAASYYLQQFVVYSGTPQWVNFARVNDNGAGVPISRTTPVLQDGATYTFQVVATSLYNQLAPGLQFTFPLVCPPDLDLTTLAISYTSGSTSIVIAASP